MPQDRILDPELPSAPVREFTPHPKRDVVPPLTAEQRQALLDSMQTLNRQLQPIVTLPDKTILDGHNRWDVAREIGWSDLVYTVVDIKDESTQVDYMLRTAIERRQLGDEQWQELIRKLRSKGWSFRRLAEATGKPKSTVADAARRQQVSGSRTPGKSIGKDGKSYPAAKPRKATQIGTVAGMPMLLVDPEEVGTTWTAPTKKELARDDQAQRAYLAAVEKLGHAVPELITAANAFIETRPAVADNIARALKQVARDLNKAAAALTPPKPETPRKETDIDAAVKQIEDGLNATIFGKGE